MLHTPLLTRDKKGRELRSPAEAGAAEQRPCSALAAVELPAESLAFFCKVLVRHCNTIGR